ncbi:MAG: hypothetical protein KC493_12075 [Bacteriovoracaceae bacterium]|nr:hypothetical protein [Bacteriovoracaceae bacterium]
MGKWSLSKLELPLKVTWKISRNSSSSKTNFLVQYSRDGLSGRGEAAYNTRYGESDTLLQNMFSKLIDFSKDKKINSVQELNNLLEQLKLPNSLRFGVECAWLDWKAQSEKTTLEDLLSVSPPLEILTCFSIPIMDCDSIEQYLSDHNLSRFQSLKLKVSGIESRPLLVHLIESYKGKIRIDGNEGFQTSDEVEEFFQGIDHSRIEFLEQPLASDNVKEQLKLKGSLPFPLVADESLTNGNITKELKDQFDGINIKLMKSGSLIKAIEQKEQALKLGLSVMLGCMVETSLGISYAFLVGEDVRWFDLDGFLLLKSDPFQLVTESEGSLRRKS